METGDCDFTSVPQVQRQNVRPVSSSVATAAASCQCGGATATTTAPTAATRTPAVRRSCHPQQPNPTK